MKKLNLLLLTISLLCVIVSCNNTSDNKQFTLLSSTQTGVDFINELKENNTMNYFTYPYIYMGGGVSVGDINNDNLDDIFFTGNMAQNRLYLNKGNLVFDDITLSAGVGGNDKWYTGSTMVDINNDGYLDIYVSVAGLDGVKNNELLINNGDNTFTEMASEYGIDDIGNSVQATFFDYDKDGDLDLYVANYPMTPFDAPSSYYYYKMQNSEDYETDNLYRNDGSSFKRVTEDAGLRTYGLTLSATVGDLNNDSYDDIIFWNFDNRSSWSSSDEGYILLSNGSSKIENWTKIPLPAGPFGFDKNKYNHAAAGDINNDGFMDVVVAITRDLPYYEGAYIQILLNNGLGELIDVTESSFSDQSRSTTHHGEGNIYLRDMNLDGNLDIVHSTRDYNSGYHGSHIAINDGMGEFTSIENSKLPDKPDPGFNNYDFLMKALPINADDEACLDFISVTDAGWENNQNETSNYFFTVLNTNCNF